jgi:hypothetical protein
VLTYYRTKKLSIPHYEGGYITAGTVLIKCLFIIEPKNCIAAYSPNPLLNINVENSLMDVVCNEQVQMRGQGNLLLMPHKDKKSKSLLLCRFRRAPPPTKSYGHHQVHSQHHLAPRLDNNASSLLRGNEV